MRSLFRRRSDHPDGRGSRLLEGSSPEQVAVPVAAPAGEPSTSHEEGSSTTPEVFEAALKTLGALLANVTVLTALLVYFGWVRAEVHAAQLGIDESLLGMTVQEYALRSVGPVVVLVVGVCVSGLLWLVAEPHLRLAVRAGPDGSRRWWRALLLRALALGWLALPLLTRLLGEFLPVLATILFPASIGAGLLLWYWTRSVRGVGLPATNSARHPMAAVLTWSLVVVCLFWTATNYAQDLGRRLADGFAGSIDRMPAVVVYSEAQLHLDGPGVVEQTLPAEEGDSYRYDGLRFVEHTGGNYFLVSEGWSVNYGVFFVLPDDTPTTRFEFVRGSP